MENWIARGDEAAAAEKLRLSCPESLPPWGYPLLCARGLDTPEKVNAFLHPTLEALQSPQALPDAGGAAEVFARIRQELGARARLVVYGDYDVDGVVASVIMKEALESFFSLPDGAVRIYIPDRHEEGYGLNLNAVETLCREADAIVTVDCGITSVREAERVMRWQETDGERKYLVITEHHTLPETLPMADALVDPLLCERMALPACDPLCGAGVALKIAELLCGRAFMESHLDLCALATVADMVPLTGDNRIIVAEGLRRLRAIMPAQRPGLYALIRAAGLEEKLATLDAADIGFRIAPRLNAAGRLESAMDSVRLLTERDQDAATSVAYALERINAERQDRVKEVRAEAEAQIEKMDLSSVFAIVTAGENWESGVVGLAAGKIAERFGYPTVCLSVQGERSVGSARSASGIDLYAALKTCEDLFERFGGHRQAAGLTLPTENIPAFASRLSAA
ncbi:MAG: single-stranded-DNA-specific exonuclease RecJ, partial [Clostridia bacterium]|nr:single-stranded-DNA-specific exonuclease RecJ [Clostridia bacterium]